MTGVDWRADPKLAARVAEEKKALLRGVVQVISEQDFEAKLARSIRDNKPLRARDLKAHGAMTVLLKNQIAPNLVQTLENNPAFIHGGPFANIAHGCNSVTATKAALKLADYVVTEAGFGADLGGEKFLDIKCRKAGLRPSAGATCAFGSTRLARMLFPGRF